MYEYINNVILARTILFESISKKLLGAYLKSNDTFQFKQYKIGITISDRFFIY